MNKHSLHGGKSSMHNSPIFTVVQFVTFTEISITFVYTLKSIYATVYGRYFIVIFINYFIYLKLVDSGWLTFTTTLCYNVFENWQNVVYWKYYTPLITNLQCQPLFIGNQLNKQKQLQFYTIILSSTIPEAACIKLYTIVLIKEFLNV